MQNQHEQYENARIRTKQKKRLYFHFILFVLGAITLAILNKGLRIGEDIITNWYLIAIVIWGFLFLIHVVNVFITNRFFGKEWERIQTDKILAKHDKKVTKLEKKVLKEFNIQEEVTSYQKNNQMITLIAAAAENNEIGKDNKLIWHLSNDLKRFKKLTSGHAIIMGRKTFESFPKALPNRTNVVITRDRNYTAENAVVVHSLEEALQITTEDSQPFIIGGGEIYKQALSIAHRIELTRVHHPFEADTYFPELNKSWKEIAREECHKDEKHEYDYSFITYERV
ncbi:MAG: dihydrofolate reductase [Kordia sp.]|nr:MAG: dihydrofolate reductase [Kordia sp.]